MTETDPDWTPEAAYAILRNSLERFIASDASATQFYNWLINDFAVPPHTPPAHPAQCLFKLALVDLAVFLQCDFDRSDLAESLHDAIAIVESGRSRGFTTITRSPCFMELMRNGQVPAPLVNLTTENTRRGWERMGFREI